MQHIRFLTFQILQIDQQVKSKSAEYWRKCGTNALARNQRRCDHSTIHPVDLTQPYLIPITPIGTNRTRGSTKRRPQGNYRPNPGETP
ncbi:hypothetical protein BJX76DRAFT_143929 [Aspergillus varians]